MTSPREQKVLPTTFASIRLFADNLQPTMVSEFFRFVPTLSYAKGDHYDLGRNKAVQQRRFGLWLFRTENIVFSPFYVDHLDFILFNFLFRSHQGFVKDFLGKNDFNMVISLFWYGRKSNGVPDINDRYMSFIRDCGGKIEVECDIIEEGADQAA